MKKGLNIEEPNDKLKMLILEEKRLKLQLETKRKEIKNLRNNIDFPNGIIAPRTYAYIRVSSEKSTNENQRQKIQAYCDKKGIVIDDWVEEVISGSKLIRNRKLGELLDKFNNGDTLIVCELSRIARDIGDGLDFLRTILTNNVNLYSLRENFSPDRGISSFLVATTVFMGAQLERDTISKRTLAALKRKRTQGVVFGRPKTWKEEEFLQHKDEILRMLDKGIGCVTIAKELNLSQGNLCTFLAQNKDYFNYPRPKKRTFELLDERENEIFEMYKVGLTIEEIVKKMPICSYSSFYQYIKQKKQKWQNLIKKH